MKTTRTTVRFEQTPQGTAVAIATSKRTHLVWCAVSALPALTARR